MGGKPKGQGQERERLADEQLLRRIQQRDQNALSEFYDARSRLVYSLAVSIVRDHDDAEEVTQEVFYRMWDKAGSFDPARGSVMAWLTTMTRRLAIDRTRSKQYKARGREASLEAAAAESAGGGSVSADGIENVVEAGEILDALQQLEPHYRDVIRLSYYEGLSHSGIAERLNTPLGTVKSRLREGVAQLRRILNIAT